MQFHLLSFEGPDAYSRAGGLATRVDGLAETLAALGFETHLWFIGDPDLPGHEIRNGTHLHRWAQWVSRHHPGGVYDGEAGKEPEFAASLPPYLLREVLLPHLRAGGRAVVLAEEWHTVHAVLHLDWLLEGAAVRKRVAMLWNANNTFGFERVPWARLARAATITTVSRYMKYRMGARGVDALVIPNGLPSDAFETPSPRACAGLSRRLRDRTVLTKMARWDPDKRWLGSIEIVAEMKRAGWSPLLIARGGVEPHGEEVRAAALARGLGWIDRRATGPGSFALLDALSDVNGANVVNLLSHVDPESRHVLFRGSDVVLANSSHEPFGLVGLETMAAGGIACTGCSGEDYAVPGRNALVLETDDPCEFLSLFRRIRANPREAQALRRAGRRTAREFAWPEIVQRVLLPRIDLSYAADAAGSARVRIGPRALARREVRGGAARPIPHAAMASRSRRPGGLRAHASPPAPAGCAAGWRAETDLRLMLGGVAERMEG
jgi:glycosyltransferase involved in cell wall biosynthesis